MVGADMCINGNLTFKGVLRIQGSVIGDVSSDGMANEMVVTDTAGTLNGAINAPHIVVRGHVSGPVRSSQTIQVQPGASLIGDVYYRELEIQAGGVVEGVLTPVSSIDNSRQPQSRQHPDPSLAISGESAKITRITEHIRPRHILGLILVLFVSVAAVVWFNRDVFVVKPMADSIALKAENSIKDLSTPLAKLVDAARTQDDRPNDPSGEVLRVETTTSASVSNSSVQAASTERNQNDSGAVVSVKGVNPEKPVDFIWVLSKESNILLTKKRLGQISEEHIDVPQGKKISVPVEEGQMFRVVEGERVEILYQGRKVGSRTISSGAWMRFVPYDGRKGGTNTHQN